MKTTDQLITLGKFLRRILTLLGGCSAVLALLMLAFAWYFSGRPAIGIVWLLTSMAIFLIFVGLLFYFTLRYITASLARPIAHLIANTQLGGRPGSAPPELVTPIAEIDLLSRSVKHMLAKSLLREDRVIGSERRLSLALRGSGEGVWDWNIQENTSYIDPNCCAILNVKPEEVEADNRIWIKCLYPEDAISAKRYFRQVKEGILTAFDEEYRLKKVGSDEHSWIQLRGSVVECSPEGLPLRMSGTVSDVTHRKNVEQQLKLYSTAFKCTKNAVIMLDKDFCVLAVNSAFTLITGQEERDLVGSKYFFQHEAISVEDFHIILKLQVHNCFEWRGEAIGNRVDSSSYPQELAIYGVFDDYKNLTHYVAIFSDITERKRTEENLRVLANYDPLTRLANRYMFNATLTRSLQTAKRKNEKVALLFIDLDHFKQVNDLLGHEAGDRLLVNVAMRIQNSIRETDTAARLAGDEFVVILENVQALADVELVAEKILNTLPLSSDESVPEAPIISASIGVSLFPDHGDSLEALLRAADGAMYRAKTLGRNRLYFCTAMDTSKVL